LHFHTIAQVAVFLEFNASRKENIPRNVNNRTPPYPGKQGKTELSFYSMLYALLCLFSLIFDAKQVECDH